MSKRTFTVYYRTGGTINFRWQRTFDMFVTREAAQEKCNELKAMGYPALYNYTDVIDRIGLPETFTADQPLAQYDAKEKHS